MCLAVNVCVSEIHLYLHYCCDRRQPRRDKSSRFIAYYALKKKHGPTYWRFIKLLLWWLSFLVYFRFVIMEYNRWARASRDMRPANRAGISLQWRTAEHTLVVVSSSRRVSYLRVFSMCNAAEERCNIASTIQHYTRVWPMCSNYFYFSMEYGVFIGITDSMRSELHVEALISNFSTDVETYKAFFMAVDALVLSAMPILNPFNQSSTMIIQSPHFSGLIMLLYRKRVKSLSETGSHFTEGWKLWKVKNRAQLLWITSEEVSAHIFTAYDCIDWHEHIWAQRMTWYRYLVSSCRRVNFDVNIRWNMRLITSANYVNRPEIAKLSSIPLIGQIYTRVLDFFFFS